MTPIIINQPWERQLASLLHYGSTSSTQGNNLTPKKHTCHPGSQRAEAPGHERRSLQISDLVREYPKLTSDDVDKFIGNGSLPAAIVLHLQRGNHVTRILLRVIHGITTEHGKRSKQSNETKLAAYRALISQACPSMRAA